MTAEPDLLPCPGCNGASVRVIGGPGTKGGPQYWAGCDYCRWRTWGNTGAEAIAEWNRRATAARDAEVEALRAEVAEMREFRDKMANAIGNDQLRRFIEKHGEPVPLTVRMQAAEARAERLAEALRLALDSHGVMLMTDPPQDAWKVRRVEEIGRALLRDQEEGNGQ